MSWFRKVKRKSMVPPAPLPEPTIPSFLLKDAATPDPIDPNLNWPYGVNSRSSNWVYSTAAAPSIPIANLSSNYTSTVTSTIPNIYNVGVSNYQPNHIIQLSNQTKEIVTLKTDGSVVWADGIHIDEAAEAFSKTLTLSAELCSGITKKVKRDMRDSIFADIISIAKEKGSLTADDLTYLLEASKIVEKLRGGKNDT